jgi:hypothetical protein
MYIHRLLLKENDQVLEEDNQLEDKVELKRTRSLGWMMRLSGRTTTTMRCWCCLMMTSSTTTSLRMTTTSSTGDVNNHCNDSSSSLAWSSCSQQLVLVVRFIHVMD